MVVAACVMVCNEEDVIAHTLQSALEAGCTHFVVLDTGSIDGTVAAVRQWAAESKQEPIIRQTSFGDFSTTRNELLEVCRQHLPDDAVLLLLDANESVEAGSRLERPDETWQAEFVQYRLKSGTNALLFRTLRLVRNVAGWAYRFPVHEVLGHPTIRAAEATDVLVTQDRMANPDDSRKTQRRWPRDLRTIDAYLQQHPDEPRMIFYRAQTLACLGRTAEAIQAYERRARHTGGFAKERAQAMIEIGKLTTDWTRARGWWAQAWTEFGCMEAALALSQEARRHRQWAAAFALAQAACQSPRDTILFAQAEDYAYSRWHHLGIVAWYAGQFKVGKAAVIAALQERPNSRIDQENLAWYLARTSGPQ